MKKYFPKYLVTNKKKIEKYEVCGPLVKIVNKSIEKLIFNYQGRKILEFKMFMDK